MNATTTTDYVILNVKGMVIGNAIASSAVAAVSAWNAANRASSEVATEAYTKDEAATKRYDGWTISAGFLDGNLGDIAADLYERCLRKCLESEFPGATIKTPSQRAEGSLPAPLRPHIYTDANEEPDGYDTMRDCLNKIERALEESYRDACEEACAEDENEAECAYCLSMASAEESVPTADNDAAWEALAAEHADDCEWILTRAHRRPL